MEGRREKPKKMRLSDMAERAEKTKAHMDSTPEPEASTQIVSQPEEAPTREMVAETVGGVPAATEDIDVAELRTRVDQELRRVENDITLTNDAIAERKATAAKLRRSLTQYQKMKVDGNESALAKTRASIDEAVRRLFTVEQPGVPDGAADEAGELATDEGEDTSPPEFARLQIAEFQTLFSKAARDARAAGFAGQPPGWNKLFSRFKRVTDVLNAYAVEADPAKRLELLDEYDRAARQFHAQRSEIQQKIELGPVKKEAATREALSEQLQGSGLNENTDTDTPAEANAALVEVVTRVTEERITPEGAAESTTGLLSNPVLYAQAMGRPFSRKALKQGAYAPRAQAPASSSGPGHPERSRSVRPEVHKGRLGKWLTAAGLGGVAAFLFAVSPDKEKNIEKTGVNLAGRAPAERTVDTVPTPPFSTIVVSAPGSRLDSASTVTPLSQYGGTSAVSTETPNPASTEPEVRPVKAERVTTVPKVRRHPSVTPVQQEKWHTVFNTWMKKNYPRGYRTEDERKVRDRMIVETGYPRGRQVPPRVPAESATPPVSEAPAPRPTAEPAPEGSWGIPLEEYRRPRG